MGKRIAGSCPPLVGRFLYDAAAELTAASTPLPSTILGYWVSDMSWSRSTLPRAATFTEASTFRGGETCWMSGRAVQAMPAAKDEIPRPQRSRRHRQSP
jgi:hypothetical protein